MQVVKKRAEKKQTAAQKRADLNLAEKKQDVADKTVAKENSFPTSANRSRSKGGGSGGTSEHVIRNIF